jgi:hypothetical protein
MLIVLNFSLICNYKNLSYEQLFSKPQLNLTICVKIPGLINNDKNFKKPESFLARLRLIKCTVVMPVSGFRKLFLFLMSAADTAVPLMSIVRRFRRL